MTFLIMGSIAFAITAVGTALVRHHAVRSGLMDLPNERSSHSVPTPRGGGLAVVSSVLVLVGSWTVFASSGSRTLETLGPILLSLLGICIVAWIGWLDDKKDLRASRRLMIHAAAATTLLPIVLTPFPVPLWMGWAAAVWWMFWAVSTINVVNFMDGIDGLVSGQAVVFGIHLLLISEGNFAGVFGSALAASALGFLCWNWAPARIFLGDVGSGALGFCFVLGGALLMRENGIGLLLAYLPLFPLFLDASLTLTRRALNGERITEPHRSHLYQRLANGGWGHGWVAFLYAVAAFFGAVVARAMIAGAPPYLIVLYGALILAVGTHLNRWASPEQPDGQEQAPKLESFPSPPSD